MDVTVSTKYWAVKGEIRKLVAKLSNMDTGYTYDTLMDATDGRAAEFSEIFSAVFMNNAGGTSNNVSCSWSSSTGIVTLGTIATSPSVGYLVIEGR